MKPVLVFGAAVLFSTWLLWSYRTTAQAQDAPTFIVGQRYAFVWDCWPEWAALYASQMVAGGAGLNPCYSEILEVRTAWRNGWITVRDHNGNVWTVNPARAVGYQPYAVPAQAAR